MLRGLTSYGPLPPKPPHFVAQVDPENLVGITRFRPKKHSIVSSQKVILGQTSMGPLFENQVLWCVYCDSAASEKNLA